MIARIARRARCVRERLEVVDASATYVRNGDSSVGWAPESAEPGRLDKICFAWVEIRRLDVVKAPRWISRCRRGQQVQQVNVQLGVECLGRCRLCNRKDQQRCNANKKNRYCLFHLSSPFV